MIQDRVEKIKKWTPRQKKVRRHYMFKKWLLEDREYWYYFKHYRFS